MTDNMHIAQEDLTLYAMQTLAAEESEAVRRHLVECAACRAELATIEGDLALVAMSAEQQPLPEGARQRFVDRLGAASQQAPPKASSRVVPIEKKRSTKATALWVSWAAAAALAVLAIVLGMRVHFLSRELAAASSQAAARAAESQRAQEVLDVLTAPTAQRVLLTANNAHPAPSARAVYLTSRGALVLEASNLEPLPQGKTYELWVIPANGAAPIPAGLFHPDASGSASVVLPKIPTGIPAKALGVTVENASGAEKPTLPIILSGAVPSAGAHAG